MPRVFIALAVDEAVRAVAARARAAIEAALPPGVRVAWCHPDDLHLTLAFLGEIEAERVERVARVVDRVACRCEPIDFEIAGVGAFPRAEHARVVWLGVGKGHAALAGLAGGLASALRDEGHATANAESEWTGHITLLRVRERSGFDAREALADCPRAVVPLTAHELCLMESRAGVRPPRYRAIFRAPITGETAFRDV